MTGVLPFVVRRLLAGLLVLFLVSAITFWLVRFAPGDPITVRLNGRPISPEARANLEHQLGLDQPIYEQYVKYIWNLARGNLGESTRHVGVPVSDIIVPKMKISGEENLYALIITFLMGIPIGIYLALRQGSWKDPAITTSLLVISAIPTVLIVPVLQIVFAVKLHWFPVSGWHGLFSKTIVLPTIALTYGGVVGIARLTRINLLQVIDEDFVRTARAKGLTERVIMVRHVLRNGFLPILNAILYSIFFLVTGDFFVELLFGIPGIAIEALSTINSRDYDELMAITLFSAGLFILANIVLDILYGVVDPRIRIGG